MKILIINVGSSSIKVDLYDMRREQRIAGATVERVEGADAVERALHAAIAQLGDQINGVMAIGHRVVHGGEQLIRPVRIDAAIEAAIDACSDFAPLHNPLNLRGIRAA